MAGREMKTGRPGAAASARRRRAWNRTRARSRGPERAASASMAATAIGGRGRYTTDRIEVTEVDREGVIVEGACVEPDIETRECAQVGADAVLGVTGVRTGTQSPYGSAPRTLATGARQSDGRPAAGRRILVRPLPSASIRYRLGVWDMDVGNDLKY